MSTIDPINRVASPSDRMLPITVAQYSEWVGGARFDGQSGQIELINGGIVRLNPQGLRHASPIDILGEWSVE